ncbi:hypothetical protein Nepgr_022300 [Nepenthes gracilis]|uniref:GATA-type domain-containing protein n=1 Tax=Nepenthes gracilis TaxID=150966 RepID=A0AAD3XXY0_NEPGR|nr:hypothetical protein Nepgr_022300 [Nepenthes gracilis]
MVELKEEGSVPQDGSRISKPSTNSKTNELAKSCSDCHTTTTPLWRGGPAGPKTLCNACGIKYHKKRRALLGLDKGRSEKRKKKCRRNSSGREIEFPLKIKMLASSGGDLLLKKSNASANLRGKLGEEEQAAILLMALSCGSVYA